MNLSDILKKYEILSEKILETIEDSSSSDIEETIEWIIEVPSTNTTDYKDEPIQVFVRNTLLVTCQVDAIENIIVIPNNYISNYKCQEITPSLYLTKFKTVIDTKNMVLYTDENTDLEQLISNLMKITAVITKGQINNQKEMQSTYKTSELVELPLVIPSQALKIDA